MDQQGPPRYPGNYKAKVKWSVMSSSNNYVLAPKLKE